MTASAGRPDRATILAFLGVAVLGGLNAIAVKVSVGEPTVREEAVKAKAAAVANQGKKG